MARKQRRSKATTALLVGAAAAVTILSMLSCINAEPNEAEAFQTEPAAEAAREVVKAPKMETTPAIPEPEPETEPAETEPAAPELDPYAVELIGRTIWGEAMGVPSKAERAAVAWCILNRVDAWGQSIEKVVTTPYQFQGYRPDGRCPQEHLDLAADVLTRWMAEKEGATDAGRVLPANYLYFMGDNERNHFTTNYKGTNYWDWSLTDPYK
jgi:hypothetical protein